MDLQIVMESKRMELLGISDNNEFGPHYLSRCNTEFMDRSSLVFSDSQSSSTALSSFSFLFVRIAPQKNGARRSVMSVLPEDHDQSPAGYCGHKAHNVIKNHYARIETI